MVAVPADQARVKDRKMDHVSIHSPAVCLSGVSLMRKAILLG